MNLIRIGLARLAAFVASFAVGSVFMPIQRVALNMRMKLSCRSGHFMWNSYFLLGTAPARSLCQIRETATEPLSR
jgi:hypothetical protein